MVLPEGLEIQYNDMITQLEEAKHMPYVTSAERIGIKRGKQEGKLEGLQEGKMETARNMLRKGMDLALIAELTGLSPETVEQLRQESKA